MHKGSVDASEGKAVECGDRLSKGMVATAILAFIGAGLSLGNLIETIISIPSSGKDIYLGWLVILGVLFSALYLLFGILTLHRKGFAFGITITAIGILPMVVIDTIVLLTAQTISTLRLLPQIELLVDIALFVLVLVFRAEFIRLSSDEKQRKAEKRSNKGVLAAGALALLGALLQILVSAIQWEYDVAETPAIVFGMIGLLYLLACIFILGRNKAGFVLGLIASPLAFLAGFSGELMHSLFLLIPNTVFAVGLFVLLIINRRKFGKREGPLIKPIYDSENTAFKDCRYHYKRDDIRKGYVKKKSL